MMKMKRIAVALVLALGVSTNSFGDISVEDPDISMGPGVGHELASGTNFSGNVSGVFEDFDLVDGELPVLRNGATSLSVVVSARRNGNDRVVRGDFIECDQFEVPLPNVLMTSCQAICYAPRLNPPAGRLDRTAIVDIALCLESRLGESIGAGFGKAPAVIKSLSAPDEDIARDPATGAALRAFFSSDVVLTAK